jgi:hypothetical protein
MVPTLQFSVEYLSNKTGLLHREWIVRSAVEAISRLGYHLRGEIDPSELPH